MSKFQVILRIRQFCANPNAFFNVKSYSTLLFDILLTEGLEINI